MIDRTKAKRLVMGRLCSTRHSMLHMTLRDFAERYGLSFGQVQDIEQMRSFPSMATRTLIEAARLDPDLIARAAAVARGVYGTPFK